MGGCRLLCVVKSKNGKNFAVLLCFYANTFILLSFLRWQEASPKSATDICWENFRNSSKIHGTFLSFINYIFIRPRFIMLA